MMLIRPKFGGDWKCENQNVKILKYCSNSINSVVNVILNVLVIKYFNDFFLKYFNSYS